MKDLLTDELRAGIYRFVRSRVGNPSTSEDLTQEILIKAARARASLREPKKLESWVFRIARNRINDFFRSSRRAGEPYDEAIHATSERFEKPESVGNEEAELRASLRRYIQGVVESLPPHYREALLATEFEGLSQPAYATRAGISLPAAKSRVQRGRKEVRRIFEACCEISADRYGNIVEARPRSTKKVDRTCGCDSEKNA
jgi:RNA polymerase sigma-70 factor, ECF subfamily